MKRYVPSFLIATTNILVTNMAEVKLNAKIYISASPMLKELSTSLKDLPREVSEDLANDELTTDGLKTIKNLLSPENKKKLFKALEESEISLPSPVYAERNAELEARCKKLRFQQEDREYRRLTKNVRNHMTNDDLPISMQMKELNAILITLVQFVVSVGCAFTFGFLVPYLWYGNQNTGTKILCGTVCGIIVGIADMYFVIRENLHNEGYVLKKIE